MVGGVVAGVAAGVGMAGTAVRRAGWGAVSVVRAEGPGAAAGA